MELPSMIIPGVLGCFFLLRTIVWGLKMAFPDWWIRRKAKHIQAWGTPPYRLAEQALTLVYAIIRLYAARYLYFSWLWIVFAWFGILSSLIALYSMTLFSYFWMAASTDDLIGSDEWIARQRRVLRNALFLHAVFNGLFLFAWLKTFPLYSLHLSATQEHIIAIAALVFAVGMIAWELKKVFSRQASSEKTPIPRPPQRRQSYRIRPDVDRQKALMTEVIPNAYDFYGEKTTDPAREDLPFFHPTAPMKNFVSSPLSQHFNNIEALCQFLEECEYVSDQEQFGQRDYWLTPKRFEDGKKGDCEDFALYTWRQLINMGYAARFVVGRVWNGGHAWVTVEHEGKCYLVEPLANPMSYLRMTTIAYVPAISVQWDGKILHYYRHTQSHYLPSVYEALALIKEFQGWGWYVSNPQYATRHAPWLLNAFLFVVGLLFLVSEIIKRERPLFRLIQTLRLCISKPIAILGLIIMFLSLPWRAVIYVWHTLGALIFRKKATTAHGKRKR